MWKLTQIIFYSVLFIAFVQRTFAQDDDADEEHFKFFLKDIVETLEPYAAKCEQQPETSHIEELILNEVNPQYTTKCLRYCLMKQFGVLTDDGTDLDTVKFVDMMSVMHPDKEEEFTDMVERCRGENEETDKCEAAHTGAMCLLREMEANGFEVPVVEQ